MARSRKSLIVYAAVAFVLEYAIGAVLLGLHLVSFAPDQISGQAAICLMLWIPALAAWVARRFEAAPPEAAQARGRLRWFHILAATGGIAAVYTFFFTALTLTGWAYPDWEIVEFQAAAANAGATAQPEPDASETPADAAAPAVAPVQLSARANLILGFAITLLMGPTLLAFLMLGHERGWRGFFLPHVLRLGKWRAYLLTGLLNGIWLAPFAFAFYGFPTDGWKPVLGAIALSIVLGGIINEAYRRTRLVSLAAICAGCFLSHIVGMWHFLYPYTNRVWISPVGIDIIVLWGIVAIAYAGQGWWREREPEANRDAVDEDEDEDIDEDEEDEEDADAPVDATSPQ